jgi:hypothetical protein
LLKRVNTVNKTRSSITPKLLYILHYKSGSVNSFFVCLHSSAFCLSVVCLFFLAYEYFLYTHPLLLVYIHTCYVFAQIVHSKLCVCVWHSS